MNNVVEFPAKQATIKILPLVDNVQQAVEKVLPLLQRSIEANGRNMSMEDVVADMLEGRSFIWGVYMKDTLIAAFTTSVVKHPQRNTLFIEFMGGADMKIWMNAALNAMKKVAKDGNLSAIEADGRIGFSKFAKATVLKKPIVTLKWSFKMGKSSTTTTSKMDPLQESYIEEIIRPGADKVAEMEFEKFTGDRVARLTPMQRAAIGGYGALTLPSEIGEATGIYRDVATRTPQERQARLDQIQNDMAPLLNRQFAQQGVGTQAQAIKANAFGDRRDVYEGERQAAF